MSPCAESDTVDLVGSVAELGREARRGEEGWDELAEEHE